MTERIEIAAGGLRAVLAPEWGGRMLRLGLTDPVGFAVYATVTVAVRLGRPSQGWDRGR